jgi:DHA1 family inner membrane transport protein
MLSPIGGALADTRGERTTMSGGLALFASGTLLCALSPSFLAFLIGYILVGLAVALYQPAAQAYLAARTPYTRRGWALGMFETSWALGALLGVAPLMQVVQETQQSAPVFWILLVAGLASLALVHTLLPDGQRHAPNETQRVEWRELRTPGALLALLFMALTLCAYDLIQIVQAPWLREALAANEAQLGQLLALAGIGDWSVRWESRSWGIGWGFGRSTAAGFLLAAMCVTAFAIRRAGVDLAAAGVSAALRVVRVRDCCVLPAGLGSGAGGARNHARAQLSRHRRRARRRVAGRHIALGSRSASAGRRRSLRRSFVCRSSACW